MRWILAKKESSDRLQHRSKGAIPTVASRNNSLQVTSGKLHCNSSTHQTSLISHQTFFSSSKDGLSCTACTLQWYWSSGNSCVYDGDYFDYYRGNWGSKSWWNGVLWTGSGLNHSQTPAFLGVKSMKSSQSRETVRTSRTPLYNLIVLFDQHFFLRKAQLIYCSRTDVE